jgi:hypothetical protein
MLASVEACMDPWDAAAWVELATDKEHGSIPPERTGARALASLSRMAPDALPSSAAETLRMLEIFLMATEVKHAAAVKGVREAQERQRMLFDPRVHMGSAEILSDLSRQEEKLHASLANIQKMVRAQSLHTSVWFLFSEGVLKTPSKNICQVSACKQHMQEEASLGGDAAHAEPVAAHAEPVDTTMTEVRAPLGNSLGGHTPTHVTAFMYYPTLGHRSGDALVLGWGSTQSAPEGRMRRSLRGAHGSLPRNISYPECRRVDFLLMDSWRTRTYPRLPPRAPPARHGRGAPPRSPPRAA